jgi:23S rRNA-intervening sequence protein
MAMSYRDLRVWQKAMELVVAVYQYSNKFPKEELYGLTSQLRRAAVSVPSNIAEGKGGRRIGIDPCSSAMPEVLCSSWKRRSLLRTSWRIWTELLVSS